MLSHLTRRIGEDYFKEYAFSALYLFKVLESSSYFDPLSNSSDEYGSIRVDGRAASSNSKGDGDSDASVVDNKHQDDDEVAADLASGVDEFKDVVLKLLFLGCMIRSANTFTLMEDRLNEEDLWISERIKVGAGLSHFSPPSNVLQRILFCADDFKKYVK
jgi:hypothetical protein